MNIQCLRAAFLWIAEHTLVALKLIRKSLGFEKEAVFRGFQSICEISEEPFRRQSPPIQQISGRSVSIQEPARWIP
jgi:hypothetical protein